MYLFEEMMDMGLKDGEWTTPDHRIVAINACIGNPVVKTMDDLVDNVRIINSVPAGQIKEITGNQLIERGCYI